MLTTMTNRYCIVVPHFNHERQFSEILPALVDSGLPLIIVDDGSDEDSLRALESMVQSHPGIVLEKATPNRGKGRAVIRAIELGAAQNFTHAIQLDADGQHDIADIARLVDESEAHPDCIISGLPQFGDDVPRARLHGRKISLWWSRIETFSGEILDSMCGFRIYPIPQFLSLCRRQSMGLRMEFDTEILVRSVWQGQAIRYVPTAVCYPENGISHFRMLRDNFQISIMHTRLFFGMLIRLPRLLYRMTFVRQVGSDLSRLSTCGHRFSAGA